MGFQKTLQHDACWVVSIDVGFRGALGLWDPLKDPFKTKGISTPASSS